TARPPMPMTRTPRHARFTRPSSHRPSPRTVEPGRPDPLGATWDGRGTNFAVFSSVATTVQLCLFDGGRERRITLPSVTEHVWHGYVRGVGPGTWYGFRVHGEWNPAAGHRCNPSKLLLDPYARHI